MTGVTWLPHPATGGRRPSACIHMGAAHSVACLFLHCRHCCRTCPIVQSVDCRRGSDATSTDAHVSEGAWFFLIQTNAKYGSVITFSRPTAELDLRKVFQTSPGERRDQSTAGPCGSSYRRASSIGTDHVWRTSGTGLQQVGRLAEANKTVVAF